MSKKVKSPKQLVSDQEVEAVVADWEKAFGEELEYKWARWLINKVSEKHIDASPSAVIEWLKRKEARSPKWMLAWMAKNEPGDLRGIEESFHQWRSRVVKATVDISVKATRPVK